ncbi:MAG: hypothetical protein IH600_05460 [Bacteroidetes bacterium]|nr:hypothetical protein [Bacteroidota bacterium]
MSNPKPIVLVDTMIIFEAHRTGCWASLTGSYDIRTVEKVLEEALRGRKNREGYIEVNAEDFGTKVIVETVTELQLLQAFIENEQLAYLDDGEKHLLTHLLSFDRSTSEFQVSTADKAAIHAACRLGLTDHLVALEELVRTGTLQIALKSQYTRSFLSAEKTKFLLNA